MQKYFLAVLISLFLFSLSVNTSLAASLLVRGFGGLVITANVPGVICSGGWGPIIIKPAGSSPAALYATTPKTSGLMNSIITGKYILGLFTPITAPICWTTSIPSVPIFAFPIIQYSTSR